MECVHCYGYVDGLTLSPTVVSPFPAFLPWPKLVFIVVFQHASGPWCDRACLTSLTLFDAVHTHMMMAKSLWSFCSRRQGRYGLLTSDTLLEERWGSSSYISISGCRTEGWYSFRFITCPLTSFFILKYRHEMLGLVYIHIRSVL